jgi:hypothetical protein
MTKTQWIVKITDNGKPYREETFEKRGQAAAYAMRWNKPGPETRYRAELARQEAK